ncbi:MAG: hypothetical protein QOE53_174 [Pseudonocardiales bacterium]|jgi:hypothetical protein|nr:hypothetical protein [Pseudonocardiales bacterium]
MADYVARAQVAAPADQSVVEVTTLHTERAGGEEIQEGLERTVDAVTRIMEDR